MAVYLFGRYLNVEVGTGQKFVSIFWFDAQYFHEMIGVLSLLFSKLVFHDDSLFKYNVIQSLYASDLILVIRKTKNILLSIKIFQQMIVIFDLGAKAINNMRLRLILRTLYIY